MLFAFPSYQEKAKEGVMPPKKPVFSEETNKEPKIRANPRIQTAEGWKRAQLKKRKQRKS
jgi:hypothetical protein